MAVPNIDWDEWSQPAIEPFMEVTIHFPSGNITLTDENIASINFVASMFDNSHVLFGPPEPTTGAIEIVDFAQEYNPINNTELTSGIQIDLYLGLWPQVNTTLLGENIVTSFEQPQYVNYVGQNVWATVIQINETYLYPTRTYRLEYTYIPEGSSELITDWFIVPGDWFERHIYAITQDTQYTIVNVVIREVLPYKYLYGTFYSTEWSYDTSSHTATVEFVDELDRLLLMDNRIDGPLPNVNVDLQDFIVGLINLYDNRLVNTLSTTDTVELPYSFYEETMATTLNKGIEALGASLIYAPDGVPYLFDLYWYDTEVTLTDDDIESYNISQSSIAPFDSIDIKAMIPARVFGQQILSLENQYVQYPDILNFSTARIYDIYCVESCVEAGRANVEHDWDYTIKDILWNRHDANQFYTSFVVIGSTIELTERSLSTLIGTAPYSISNNGYIPTLAYAQVLYNKLNTYIFERYFIVEISLRGCYGFWTGGLIHLTSDLYGIDADYSIISISFSYTGAIHTELTLQRID